MLTTPGHDGLKLREEPGVLRRLAEVGNAAAEDRLRQVAAPGDPEAPVAAERALPLLGHIHLVVGGIIDDAGDDLPLALEPDRDREHRNRVQKVGRRVERIDVPGVAFVSPLDPAALLQHETVARTRFGELLIEGLFRPLVRKTDEVARTLHRHLQLADLAEIAFESAPRLDRGAGHHGHQGGADHGRLVQRAGAADGGLWEARRRGKCASWPDQ